MRFVAKRIFPILFISIIFLALGFNFVQAVGVCEPCSSNADCDTNLSCENGKCHGCPSGGIAICNPLNSCDFTELIDKIINFVFWVAVAIVPLMALIAGFYFVTAAGDPNKINTAKKILIYTAIGFVIILFAKGLISVLQQVLGYNQ